MNLLITGGAGFIGSHFVDFALEQGASLCVLDSLTYAGNLSYLSKASSNENFSFVHGDICNEELVSDLLYENKVDAIINFAAHSHVDRSINSPTDFIQSNIVGVQVLLDACRSHFAARAKEAAIHFLQVSTDEVFGSLGPEDPPFTEQNPLCPSSPYSASKAAAEHLVNAWHLTYGLKSCITNCTNNFGSRQHPEKLIPRMIVRALQESSLPIFADGKNSRNWIHVKDHCAAIWKSLTEGQAGQRYCFAGKESISNLDLVHNICDILDQKRPRPGKRKYKELIEFVSDRLGHDFRYDVDDSWSREQLKIQNELHLSNTLELTVDWYIQEFDSGSSTLSAESNTLARETKTGGHFSDPSNTGATQ